jgi:hypothetical protein
MTFKRKLVAAVFVASLFGAEHAHAADTISPIVSGMVIDTKEDLLQQVEVRVKSLGPGMCSTRITFANESTHLGAPPLVWSNWFKLSPAVSGGAYSVDLSPECDGDVIGEIKYVAD